MKISIITVCFNAADTIGACIDSVSMQSHSDVEHIIVDGGSSDGTLQIIESSASVSKYLSEPDKGIYDAMNKGISMAEGEIIGLLNADDIYAHGNVLKIVDNCFNKADVDACYADLVYVRRDDVSKVVRYWKSCEYTDGLFQDGWMPAHPTFFAKKIVYDRCGLFSLDFKIAADFELLNRFIAINKVTTKYIPEVLIKMRMGGTTNQSVSNIWKQNAEMVGLLKRTYEDFSLVKFVAKKAFSRLFQYAVRTKIKQ